MPVCHLIGGIMEANLTYLRREVMKYEKDPNHTITQHHIALRMACVVKFGAEAVRQIVSEVCQQLLEARQCSFAHAKKPLSPEVVKAKKSSSGLARNAKPKKTSITSRLGYRGINRRR